MTAGRFRTLLIVVSASGVGAAVWQLGSGAWQTALVLYLLTVSVLCLLVAVAARRSQTGTARPRHTARPAWFGGEMAECARDED